MRQRADQDVVRQGGGVVAVRRRRQSLQANRAADVGSGTATDAEAPAAPAVRAAKPASTADDSVRAIGDAPQSNRANLFQPLELHLQPADLLEKFHFVRRALIRLPATPVLEQARRSGEQLLLPDGHLAGVDLVLAGQLGCLLVPRHAAKATFTLNAAPKLRRFLDTIRTS